MNKPEITYPCEWCYTIIGAKESLMHDAVAVVFWGKEYSVVFSNKSKAGKYVSLLVKTKVDSEDERKKLFDLLCKQPAIKMVL
jgi:putative lipoic acid-binding regulatory protein